MYQVEYKAIFKGANWRVGTKDDPKKEYGIISLCFVVPGRDGKDYVKDVDEFIFEKSLLPQGIQVMDKVTAIYEFNPHCPTLKPRFIEIV